MKKILLFLSLTLSLTSFFGCDDVRTETSDILKERAIVVTLIHSPSEHNTELTSTMYHNNGIIGTDWNGNSGIRIGRHVQLTSTTIPEKFGVAFQCQHGTFTVEGSETKHRVLYDKLTSMVGDTVTVMYKEIYTVTYKKVNGKDSVVSRVLSKLDFIDAQK